MQAYKDIADLPEDERIAIIGDRAVKQQLRVGFFVEDDGEKADRYVRKLRQRFPGIQVFSQVPGPVAGTIIVSVGPPAESVQ